MSSFQRNFKLNASFVQSSFKHVLVTQPITCHRSDRNATLFRVRQNPASNSLRICKTLNFQRKEFLIRRMDFV